AVRWRSGSSLRRPVSTKCPRSSSAGNGRNRLWSRLPVSATASHRSLAVAGHDVSDEFLAVAPPQAHLDPCPAVDKHDLAHRQSRGGREAVRVHLTLTGVVVSRVLFGGLLAHVLVGLVVDDDEFAVSLVDEVDAAVYQGADVCIR